jgi:hypothetical protein
MYLGSVSGSRSCGAGDRERAYVRGRSKLLGGACPNSSEGRRLDLAVVVSPMSGPIGSRPDLYAASRRHAAAVLRREVNALHAVGIPTLVFSPGPGEQDVMGNDFMSARRLTDVIQQSFLAAGARASSPNARPLMQLATQGRRTSTKRRTESVGVDSGHQ